MLNSQGVWIERPFWREFDMMNLFFPLFLESPSVDCRATWMHIQLFVSWSVFQQRIRWDWDENLPDLCILSPPDESPDGSQTFTKGGFATQIFFNKFHPKNWGEKIPILTFLYISNGLVSLTTQLVLASLLKLEGLTETSLVLGALFLHKILRWLAGIFWKNHDDKADFLYLGMVPANPKTLRNLISSNWRYWWILCISGKLEYSWSPVHGASYGS